MLKLSAKRVYLVFVLQDNMQSRTGFTLIQLIKGGTVVRSEVDPLLLKHM